jgi:hypothetical protein
MNSREARERRDHPFPSRLPIFPFMHSGSPGRFALPTSPFQNPQSKIQNRVGRGVPPSRRACGRKRTRAKLESNAIFSIRPVSPFSCSCTSAHRDGSPYQHRRSKIRNPKSGRARRLAEPWSTRAKMRTREALVTDADFLIRPVSPFSPSCTPAHRDPPTRRRYGGTSGSPYQKTDLSASSLQP